MPSSNVCWGIEIGACAIKALKLEADGTRANLLDFACIEHPKVLSTPGVDANDVLRVSLGTLVAQKDLSGAAVAISVPGHSSFARFAKLPPVEPKKVPDIVKFEAIQQIPFPLEQVEWDYQTFVSPDSPEVEVGIFAITRERILERLRMLEDVGITPDYVTLSPLGVFNGLAYDLELTEKSPGTLIVDIGTTSTDIVVSDSGRVWIRTFPIGGHHFTEALVGHFKCSYQKAEALKQEAEKSPHAKQVFQAMRPVFTDLGQDIQRSISYHQSLHKDSTLTRLIGVGSTFRLPGLRKFLKQQLNMEVYRVEEFKRVNTQTLKDEALAKQFQERSLTLGTAYGLALQGLGLSAINANLMPVHVIRETMWRGKVKWFGLAAGVAAAASAAMFIRPIADFFAMQGNQPPAEIANALSQSAQAKATATEKGVTGAATPDFRAANMLALLERRDVYPHIVNDLGEMMEFAEQAARAAPVRPAEGAGATPEAAKAAGPAFSLRIFETMYDGGGAMAAPDGSDSGVTSNPRVRIGVRVSTTRDNADQFLAQTLDRWLKERAGQRREGVPYVITNPRWIRVSSVEADPEAAAGEGEIQPVETIGRGGGGRRGRDYISESPRGRGGGEIVGDGGGSGEGLQLAPLTLLQQSGPAGKVTVTYQLDWNCEFAPAGSVPGETDGAVGGASGDGSGAESTGGQS